MVENVIHSQAKGVEGEPLNWVPQACPKMRLSDMNQRERIHSSTGSPYPFVQINVDDPDYKGPISKIISTTVDPGCGAYAYCLDSFKLFDANNRVLATSYSRDEIFVNDHSLTPKDIAEALEAFKVALI